MENWKHEKFYDAGNGFVLVVGWENRWKWMLKTTDEEWMKANWNVWGLKKNCVWKTSKNSSFPLLFLTTAVPHDIFSERLHTPRYIHTTFMLDSVSREHSKWEDVELWLRSTGTVNWGLITALYRTNSTGFTIHIPRITFGGNCEWK
jgi:hypothetical protein